MNKKHDLQQTSRIVTTHIYQNHLDAITSDLENFCDQYKQYALELTQPKLVRDVHGSVARYLDKSQPKSFKLCVKEVSGKGILTLDVGNGISISTHDAAYELYALYHILESELDQVRVGSGITFLRRYWLFNLGAAIEFIPAIFMFAAGNWVWATGWLIAIPLSAFVIVALIFNYNVIFWDDIAWNDVLLSTKISYGHYSNRPGPPFIAALSSARFIVSILASIATIASFIFVIFHR